MSSRIHDQSRRYDAPNGKQRPSRPINVDYVGSDRKSNSKGEGRADESSQNSHKQTIQQEQRNVQNEEIDELYEYLLRDIKGLTIPEDQRRADAIEADHGVESLPAKDRALDALPVSLPRPDTSMFEELAKLSPNPLMYMITSNLKRKAIAEVHYWATLRDLLYKDASGRTVAVIGTAEFLRRILYELHIRNSLDDKVSSTFTLFAQFGLDSSSTLHPVIPETERSVADALQHHNAFLESTSLPVHKQVLRFHLDFSSRPNGYASAQPSKRITKHYLSLLKNPIVPNSDGTLAHQDQDLQRSSTQATEARPSLRRSDSAITTLSDFIPAPRPRDTMDSVISGLPVDQMPLKQFGRQLIPERLLKLDGIFSEKQPNILARLGPRLGVAGIYNLDEGLLDTPSPNGDEWRACCSVLPDLNADELARDVRARSIPILRSTLRITPPQFYSAVEILRRPAGFLAHDMGIGKTHTVLAAVALRVLILNSKRVCEQAWSSGSKGQHLGRNLQPQQGQRCPSQTKRPGDVLCYCVPGGLTREIGRRTRGMALIQVPANARTEWINAIAQAKFSKVTYDFVVVSQSSDVPADLRRGREFFKVFESNWKLSPVLKPGAQISPDDFGAADYFDWQIGAKFGYLEPYVFVVGHTDAKWYDMFKMSIHGWPGHVYAAPVGLSFIDEAHTPELWAASGSASHIHIMAR